MNFTPRYLLCPSEEGCRIARPWGRPLADFAVDEFLALCKLVGAPSAPLGDPEAVALAKARLRSCVGPVPIEARLDRTQARAVSARLVTGTLYEVLCDAPDLQRLRERLLALENRARDDGAGKILSSRQRTTPYPRPVSP